MLKALFAHETVFWEWLREAWLHPFYHPYTDDDNDRLEYQLANIVDGPFFPAIRLKEEE